LINFGDFLENNHPLVPSSYCYEWWLQELAEKTPIKELGDLKNPEQEKALSLSDTYKVPLHPKYTYLCMIFQLASTYSWQNTYRKMENILIDYLSRWMRKSRPFLKFFLSLILSARSRFT